MDEKEIKEIKQSLAIKLEKHISIIKEEYKEFVPIDTLNFLNSINNYEELIKIADTGTITCYVKNRKIYLPLLANKFLGYLKRVPGFGVRPKHKTYTSDTLVLNDNTFNTYLIHAFLSGLSTEGFYEEMPLHEVMHLCGMNGSNALLEGLTELKTRELAKKYDLKTSACGYPKEVKIVYKLQEMFGVSLMNKIAFSKSRLERRMIIIEELGEDALSLFEEINNLMEEEFQNKYYKQTSSFNGIRAPFIKTKKYNEIDYTKVYKLLDGYHKSKEPKR